jgi:LmbE family N-acetylglucosaminyl deacetylase
MLRFNLDVHANNEFTLLCLGAHSDDIEIGCGGTVLQLVKNIPKLKIHWVVLSATGARVGEAKKSAALFAAGRQCEVVLKEFRDSFFPYQGGVVKEFFAELGGKMKPDLILTHWQGDAHQDHRLVNQLTWNTFRDHAILEYEVPKYDGDMGRPNVYVPLEQEMQETKVAHLLESFDSQRSKRWFDRETFLGLMRIRGMECNSPSGYAEAFYARKLVIETVTA